MSLVNYDPMMQMHDPAMMHYNPWGLMDRNALSLAHSMHDLNSLAAAPAMDVRELEKGFLVSLRPPPGFTTNDLHLNIERDVLYISGEKNEEEKMPGHQSKRKMHFSRSIRLPETVDHNRISARWALDGILLVDVPKLPGLTKGNMRRIDIEGMGEKQQLPAASSSSEKHSSPAAGAAAPSSSGSSGTSAPMLH